MNRFNWIYVADNAKRYNVGLMHGAKSGHLLVYCNSKIILIDFEVLEDKSYSLFIDEQLCEIIVERKGDQFYYGFEINTKADTPLNRQRKKIEKKNLLKSALVLVGMIILVSGFVWGLRNWQDVRTRAALADQFSAVSKETHAQFILSEEGDDRSLSYFFIVNGKAYTIEKDFSPDEPAILETGLPLEAGDEFIVSYVPTNPKLHTIDYTRPTEKQLVRYQERVVDRYLNQHPGTDPSYVNCLARTAFDFKGIEGIADLYHLDTSPSENAQHNENSYKRLVRDEPFRALVRERCAFFQ